jgi:hypothetical protein
MSHLLLLANIIFAISFSGFCVGCVVFSGMLQKGMLISVQTLDGIVNLKFQSFSSAQSLASQSSVLYGAITFLLIFTSSILNV